MSEKEIGGYDRYSFVDKHSVDSLSLLLEKSGEIKTHIQAEDKFPNFDGFIEILTIYDKKSIPIGRFSVQIKSLESDYHNNNKIKNNDKKYKYECESKVLNSAKEKITLDPVIIFLVDNNNNKIFWIYLSDEYLYKLNLGTEKNKTIYFDDNDIISNDNLSEIIVKLKEIYSFRKKCLDNGSLNYTLVNDDLDSDIKNSLLKEIDYFNHVMDTDLKFIKYHLFNNIWKFGVAYFKDEHYTQMGIFIIKKNEQGNFIRIFRDANEYQQSFRGRIVEITHKDSLTLHETILDELRVIVEIYFKNYYIHPVFLPTIILEEIAYGFLDEISEIFTRYELKDYPLVYYNNKENVAVIHNYLRRLSKLTGGFGNSIYLETVNELIRRNINYVNRIWKHKDISGMMKDLQEVCGLNRIENCYRINDFYDNVEKLLTLLPDTYNKLLSCLFGQDKESYSLNNRYDVYINPQETKFGLTYGKKDSNEFIINVNRDTDSNDLYSYLKSLPIKYNYYCEKSIGNAFHSKLPLYNHLGFLLYKSICNKFSLKIRSDLFIDILID